ncbi:hypothetical protein [Campylobacter armoricus]|nr:hypothetical protein [Campylobacter armoricus]
MGDFKTYHQKRINRANQHANIFQNDKIQNSSSDTEATITNEAKNMA